MNPYIGNYNIIISIGLPKKAMGILYHITNPKNSMSYTSEEVEIASKYLSELIESLIPPKQY